MSGKSDAARSLQGSRRKRLRDCEVCGKPFYGISIKRYCCHACAQSAYKKRHRAKDTDPSDPQETPAHSE